MYTVCDPRKVPRNGNSFSLKLDVITARIRYRLLIVRLLPSSSRQSSSSRYPSKGLRLRRLIHELLHLHGRQRQRAGSRILRRRDYEAVYSSRRKREVANRIYNLPRSRIISRNARCQMTFPRCFSCRQLTRVLCARVIHKDWKTVKSGLWGRLVKYERHSTQVITLWNLKNCRIRLYSLQSWNSKRDIIFSYVYAWLHRNYKICCIRPVEKNMGSLLFRYRENTGDKDSG